MRSRKERPRRSTRRGVAHPPKGSTHASNSGVLITSRAELRGSGGVPCRGGYGAPRYCRVIVGVVHNYEATVAAAAAAGPTLLQHPSRRTDALYNIQRASHEACASNTSLQTWM